jgi:hypothetical protein
VTEWLVTIKEGGSPAVVPEYDHGIAYDVPLDEAT